MPAANRDETLAASRHVVIILRLVLDRRGRVHHGELLDAEARLLERFAGPRGLRRALREWCHGQRRAAAAAEGDPPP